jgi:hypothetical protein
VVKPESLEDELAHLGQEVVVCGGRDPQGATMLARYTVDFSVRR